MFEGISEFISIGGIIETTIGAFLGFGSAILTEKLISDSEKKKTISNIIDELIAYKHDLGELIIPSLKINLEADHFELQPYEIEIIDSSGEKKRILTCLNDFPKRMVYSFYTPIWDTTVETGDILEFKDNDYFNDLIVVYSNIKKLNSLVESYYNRIDDSSSEDMINRLKYIIVQSRYVYSLLSSNYLPSIMKLLSKGS